ncbi:TetR/AcrR family transcriptional regulator [Dyella nitratireducens]
MARPLSDVKRNAILNAAAKLVATHGTGASTPQIARAAKVAEGTVFIYFETKDALLNELFVVLETGLFRAIEEAFPFKGDANDQLQHVWSALIEWGASRAIDRQALRQLKVSERVTSDSRDRCAAQYGKVLASIEASLKGRVDPKRMSFYLGHVLMSLVETTLDAITANPKQRNTLKQAGFDLFWKGIQR